MKHIKIKKLKFLDNFIIEILLCDGRKITYDLKPKLETGRFLGIADKEKFRKGKIINNKLIRWDEITEISISEIIINIERNRDS